jgi:hypothetical protein
MSPVQKLCLYVTFLVPSVVDVRILKCNIYHKVITIDVSNTISLLNNHTVMHLIIISPILMLDYDVKNYT